MSELTDKIVQLRQTTQLGMLKCKAALEHCDGDIDAAVDYLRKQGELKAGEKYARATDSGIVESYVHARKIGVLIELGCETDYVAMNSNFKQLARDIAMHIAASNPDYLSSDEVPVALIESETIAVSQTTKGWAQKPDAVRQKILEGKWGKLYSTLCLLNQPFIKDDSLTVQQVINQAISVLGENIKIKRFVRYQIGE